MNMYDFTDEEKRSKEISLRLECFRKMIEQQRGIWTDEQIEEAYRKQLEHLKESV